MPPATTGSPAVGATVSDGGHAGQGTGTSTALTIGAPPDFWLLPMTSTPPTVPAQAEPEPVPTPVDCAEQLKARFPALFGGGFKPLKLRIQADIQERAPGAFAKQALSAFLRRHTGRTGYLVAMTRSPHRFDLDGQPSGEVSAEHRQAAADELARRRGLRQATVDQAEEGRRLRASLLRDFEQTTLTRDNFCALKRIAPQALDALLATARQEAQAQAQAQARPAAPFARPQPPGPPGRHPGRPAEPRKPRDARPPRERAP